MKIAAALAALVLAGCSTVQSRLDDPPDFTASSPTTVAAFQSCFVTATANQNVAYLPRGTGGTFTASAGPQNYVSWVVTIDDSGTSRLVSVHAVGPSGAIVAKVRSCLS